MIEDSASHAGAAAEPAVPVADARPYAPSGAALDPDFRRPNVGKIALIDHRLDAVDECIPRHIEKSDEGLRITIWNEGALRVPARRG